MTGYRSRRRAGRRRVRSSGGRRSGCSLVLGLRVLELVGVVWARYSTASCVRLMYASSRVARRRDSSQQQPVSQGDVADALRGATADLEPERRVGDRAPGDPALLQCRRSKRRPGSGVPGARDGSAPGPGRRERSRGCVRRLRRGEPLGVAGRPPAAAGRDHRHGASATRADAAMTDLLGRAGSAARVCSVKATGRAAPRCARDNFTSPEDRPQASG